MGEINYTHKEMAEGRWAEMSLAEQMGNIGSEVSRALKARARRLDERAAKAVDRALELFDLTIDAMQKRGQGGEDVEGKLKEICRAREEVCDFFCGDNEYQGDAERLMRYYDWFAMRARTGR